MPEPRSLLISPMRNEGPFILEWLAWHRMLGFDDILVLSNDCTDGSDRLLDALAARNLLSHIRHSPTPGSFALRSAFQAARAAPQITQADWVMVLDADEFLVVHHGARKVQDLLKHLNHAPLGIAVHWKCFGDNGQGIWQPGLVRHQFTATGPTQDRANMRFKSIFRDPLGFQTFSSHTPRDYQGEWGGNNIWVTSDGKPIKKIDLTKGERSQSTAMRRITHEVAQVNHYAIKAQNCLTERRQKWTSSDRAARYDAAFVERYNINSETDLSALAQEADFETHFTPLINDPEISALHAQCIAAYQTALTS